MSKIKSFLASYAAHLAGYVVSAAGIASTIDPKLIPPQYSFLTAVAGLVTVAAHNGFSAGKASAAVQAAATAATKALTAAAPALLVGFLLIGTLGLSGCATIAKVDTAITSPAAQPILAAAAGVAVATAEQHGITAAQISSIATQALAADAGTAATLATVAGVVNIELAKLNLPAADIAAAQAIEVLVGAAIQDQVGNNAALLQTQAATADVLKAIIAAAGSGV